MKKRKQRPHYINKNLNTRIPSNLLFLDSETTGERRDEYEYHRMRLAVTCHVQLRKQPLRMDYEVWRFHYKQAETCKYIESCCYDNKPLYLFASNPGFDLGATGFIDYFTSHNWQLQFYTSKGMMFILTIKKGKKKIIVLAIQNFFPVSVKALGEMINRKKLDINVFTDNMDLLTIYCFRDVEILVDSFIYYLTYIQQQDLGGFAYTRSSQAMKAFRHRFMTDKLLIRPNNNLHALERTGYFGGRVECFRLGKQPDNEYYLLDINAMYPYVMSINDFPVKAVGHVRPHDIADLRHCLLKYCITARVLLDTNEPVYGKRIYGKCCFPIGTFWTTLNTRMLQYAIEHNHIKDISHGILYEKAPVFNAFVDYFYSERIKAKRNKNRPLEICIKNISNSLYGKFAEQHDDKVINEYHKGNDFIVEEVFDAVNRRIYERIIMFHRRIEYGDKKLSSHTSCTISAHITEDARLILWNLIKKCGLNNVYYCDTDSLIISRETYEKHLIHNIGEKLGQLKVEKVSRELNITTLKNYRLGDKVVSKGIHKDSILNPDGSFHVLQFLTFNSYLRKGIKNAAVIRHVNKHISGAYNKGIVHPDKTITPLHLFEPEDSLEIAPVRLE